MPTVVFPDPLMTCSCLLACAPARHRANLSIGFYRRSVWAPNRFGAFGELRGLPYYCSTAGQHPRLWVSVYEVRDHAPDR